MEWIKVDHSEMRGNIETRGCFLKRNWKWWKENESFERRRRLKYYVYFLKFGGIETSEKDIVGEVGPGPFGGIIEVCKLSARRKVFVDYMMEHLVGMEFIKWPPEALYVDSPAESIPLPENYIDVLLSYNTLDHGWNVFDCIKECIRISKKCYLSFDCRADDMDQIKMLTESNDLDHYQLITFSDIERFMKNKIGDTVSWKLVDMETKQFPVVYLEITKNDTEG
jgi:hypothetical protein